MKRVGGKRVVALALTWDGARWPLRSLPPKARVFLTGEKAPSAIQVAKLFEQNEIKEIRICWVPRLQGGDPTLSEPFHRPDGKRLPFRVVRCQFFDDVLGVVYRR